MTQEMLPQTHLPSLRQKRVVPAELKGDSSWTGFHDEPLAVGILPPWCAGGRRGCHIHLPLQPRLMSMKEVYVSSG